MLPRLLLRDWVLNRRSLLAFVAVFAAFQILFVQLVPKLPRLWLVGTCLWACALTILPFAREDKFRTAAWACTLPVIRADLVRARYVGSWIFVAGVLLLALAMAMLMPGVGLSAVFALHPATWLLAGGVITMILMLLLPFVVRFGLRGLVIPGIGVNVLLAGTFVVSKATGGQDDVEGGVIAAVDSLAEGIAVLREGLPGPVFYLVAVLLLVLLNWAGYRLTLALFLRREF